MGWSLVASLGIFSHAALPFLSRFLTTFIHGYMETLSLREAPSLCLLSINVNSLWQSLGLLALSSPLSLPIGTNGSHGLYQLQSSLHPRSSPPFRQRPLHRSRPPHRQPAPPHASSPPHAWPHSRHTPP